jgi:hypothetical protein
MPARHREVPATPEYAHGCPGASRQRTAPPEVQHVALAQVVDGHYVCTHPDSPLRAA